jgi:homoprotocatechuate degradation regulator HpaR
MTMRQFSRSLPMALMRAREAVMSEFRPILAEHDVTEQQWRVLRAVVDQEAGQGAGLGAGLGVGELSERTFLLGPSVSRILAALESRGLVDRWSVDHDARRAVIVATPEGRDLYELISPSSEAIYVEVERRFGVDELDQLYQLLDRLAAAMKQPVGGAPAAG